MLGPDLQVHRNESEYQKSLYYKKHMYCPECGSDHNSQTLVGYIMDLQHPEQFEDRNRATWECGWIGTVHELTANAKPKEPSPNLTKQKFLQAFDTLGICSERYIYRWTCDCGTDEERLKDCLKVVSLLDELVRDGEIFELKCGSRKFYGPAKELDLFNERIHY